MTDLAHCYTREELKELGFFGKVCDECKQKYVAHKTAAEREAQAEKEKAQAEKEKADAAEREAKAKADAAEREAQAKAIVIKAELELLKTKLMVISNKRKLDVESELKNEITTLKFELHRISENILITTHRVNPSECCKSAKYDIFQYILKVVQLDCPDFPTVLPNTIKLFKSPFTKEADMYPKVIEYLSPKYPNQDILNVSSSKEPFFSTNVFSIKPENLPTSLLEKHNRPRYCFNIAGNPDLVFLDKPGIVRYVPSPTNSIFVIELKLKVDLYSLRQAVLQVLGLNVSNTRRSPPVVLTDLTKYYLIVYIVCNDEASLKYSIILEQFKSFDEVIEKAIEIGNRKSVTSEFARPPTEQSSPESLKKRDDGEIGSSINEEFENIKINMSDEFLSKYYND